MAGGILLAIPTTHLTLYATTNRVPYTWSSERVKTAASCASCDFVHSFSGCRSQFSGIVWEIWVGRLEASEGVLRYKAVMCMDLRIKEAGPK